MPERTRKIYQTEVNINKEEQKDKNRFLKSFSAIKKSKRIVKTPKKEEGKRVENSEMPKILYDKAINQKPIGG